MHYPFTAEQLLELIEFVARAITSQARPSGGDGTAGGQAVPDQPASPRTCPLSHWGLRFHQSSLRSGPAGPAELTAAAH